MENYDQAAKSFRRALDMEPEVRFACSAMFAMAPPPRLAWLLRHGRNVPFFPVHSPCWLRAWALQASRVLQDPPRHASLPGACHRAGGITLPAARLHRTLLHRTLLHSPPDGVMLTYGEQSLRGQALAPSPT